MWRAVEGVWECRLEPIVARIGEKRSAVLCPMIDAISDLDMGYPDYSGGGVSIGGFTWSLFFNWFARPKDAEKPKTAPVEYSPSQPFRPLSFHSTPASNPSFPCLLPILTLA